MKVQEIKYAGITSATSDYDCADGELSIAHNVVNENGAIRTVRDPKVVLSLDKKYLITTVHQTAEYRHYIIVKTDPNSESIYSLHWFNGNLTSAFDIETEKYQLQENNRRLPSSDGINAKSIKAVGNSLVVFTDGETHYYLWKQGAYMYLGTAIPQLPIQFGLYIETPTEADDISDCTNWISLDNSGGSIQESELSDWLESDDEELSLPQKYQKNITDGTLALVNRKIQDETNHNRFALPFMVRYAIKLYDGSYIMQSSPVLMIPETYPFVYLYEYGEGGGNLDRINVRFAMFSGTLRYKVYQSQYIEHFSNWSNIVVSVDVFVSPLIYLFDINGSVEKLIHPKHNSPGNYPVVNDSHYHVPFIGVGDWEYIRNVGQPWTHNPNNQYNQYRMTSDIKAWARDCFPDATTTYAYKATIPLKAIEVDKIRDSIVNETRFYKISSIAISDLASSSFVNVPLKNDVLKSLTSNEQLPDGYMTNEKLSFKDAFEYNSRMVYYGVTRNTLTGFASTLIAYTNISHVSGEEDLSYYLNVYTKVNNDDKYRQYMSSPLAAYGNVALPYIFIPDTRVEKIHLQIPQQGSLINNIQKTFDTIKHPLLNGVYVYLEFDDICESLTGSPLNPSETAGPTTSYSVRELNKIYISEANNPFLIKPTGIVTIDVPEILGISTTTKALSQGQFGQFPMYAFTGQGIWAMEVSSAGAIIAKQPISRDMVLGDGRSITQTDNAVLFASINGIQMIQGADIANISKDIDPTDTYSYESMPGLANILSDQTLPTVPFATFINDCRMVYDYRHRRVVVYNPSYNYAYLFSFDTMRWSTTASDFISDVNAYPKALATRNVGTFHILVDLTGETQDGEHFQTVYEDAEIDYEEEGETYTEEYNRTVKKIEDFEPQGFLVTRPIKLQTHNLKTIRVTLQRGDFRNNTFTTEEEVRDSSPHYPDSIIHSVPVTRTPHVLSILYGSRDLEHWFVVASSTNGNLRGFSGTPYKYFRIALLMDLRYSESVSGCTIQYEEKHTNQIR